MVLWALPGAGPPLEFRDNPDSVSGQHLGLSERAASIIATINRKRITVPHKRQVLWYPSSSRRLFMSSGQLEYDNLCPQF